MLSEILSCGIQMLDILHLESCMSTLTNILPGQYLSIILDCLDGKDDPEPIPGGGRLFVGGAEIIWLS